MLGREELKMEVKKYKNISLRCIKEMQRLGGKVPGYAAKLVKEEESGTHIEGLKETKSESATHLDDKDADSMFEDASEINNEDFSDRAQIKID